MSGCLQKYIKHAQKGICELPRDPCRSSHSLTIGDGNLKNHSESRNCSLFFYDFMNSSISASLIIQRNYIKLTHLKKKKNILIYTFKIDNRLCIFN